MNELDIRYMVRCIPGALLLFIVGWLVLAVVLGSGPVPQ